MDFHVRMLGLRIITFAGKDATEEFNMPLGQLKLKH